MIQANNTVYFLKNAPVDPSYDNVMQFSSESNQNSTFMSYLKPGFGFTGCALNNTGDTLYTSGLPGTYQDCNYLMWRNPQYDNKWFYAFIGNARFEAEGTTALDFKVDLYMTWYFEWQLLTSYMDREHVVDDTIGANLVPDSLDTGEFIVASDTKFGGASNDYTPVLLIAYSFSERALDIKCSIGDAASPTDIINIPYMRKQFSGGRVYSGLYSGTDYIAFDYLQGVSYPNKWISNLVRDGQIDKIQSITIIPKWLINYWPETQVDLIWWDEAGDEHSDGQVTAYVPGGVLWNNTPAIFNGAVSRPSTIDGYTPLNNKLFTMPYCFVSVDNGAGTAAEYGFEYGGGNSISIEQNGVIGGSPIMRITPLNYKGSDYAYQESIELTNFPLASYQYSAYENELGATRNTISGNEAVRQFQATRGGLAGTFGALLGGNQSSAPSSFGGALGGALGGSNFLGIQSATDYALESSQKLFAAEDRLREPAVVKGSNATSMNAALKELCFRARVKTVTAEFARIIDNYWTRYGYPIHRLKQPQRTGRQNYNYVKCINATVKGSCPYEVIVLVKSIFEKGVTEWHSATNFMNFSVSNGIV